MEPVGGAGIGTIAGSPPKKLNILSQGQFAAIGAGFGFIAGSIVGPMVGSSRCKSELIYESDNVVIRKQYGK